MRIFAKLTPRENQVANLLIDCLQNKEIANKLGISERTVKYHMHNIYGKFGIETNRHGIEGVPRERPKLILELARLAGTLAIVLILAVSLHAQSSATITVTQPTQPSGETLASTLVIRDGATIATLAPGATQYVDTNVNPGETHVWAMSNVDSIGIAAVSASISGTIPGTITPPPPPPPSSGSFWNSSLTPANVIGNDSASVELGLKFSSSQSGFITGIRFYQATNSTGTHTGTLWSSTGTKLATGTFPAGSAGWQTLTFATPVAITAGTTYVASYHTIQYVWTPNYFTSSLTVSPLTAPSGNGLYRYGTSSSMPNLTFQATNYFVDVMFQSGTVVSPIAVKVTPAAATLQIGQVQQFTAAVTNAADTSVMWSPDAPQGLFAASTAGTFVITAISNADPSKSATATVTVAPPPLTWVCAGNTCVAGGGAHGQVVPTQLNPPSGPTGSVTLP